VALLLTIWIFIVLFVIVLDFATAMRDDGLATANFADETRVYYIALAGLNQAVYDVLGQLEENPDLFVESGEPPGPEDVDEVEDEEDEGFGFDDGLIEPISPDGTWHEREFGGGTFAVRLLDESAKISLNRAEEPLLMRVIRRLVVGGNATEGASIDQEREVSTIVGSILDWRDPDDLEHLNGAEADYYASEPGAPAIKNGPFDSVDELLSVRGVTPELFYGLAGEPGFHDIFSVDSRTDRINVAQAPAAVLRVLLDIDAETAEQLVADRELQPFGFVEHVREMMMAIDPVLAPLLQSGPSPVMTVEARGMLGERNQAHVAAVMDLRDTFEGPLVMRWFDRVPAGWSGFGTSEEDPDAEPGTGAEPGA
jgi:general secretion pathway protein K